jgi:hypothetical protein
MVILQLLAFGNLHKGWDRTIQRLGDGAKQFGFAFLDQTVRTDDLHADFDPILLEFCGAANAMQSSAA